MNPIILVQARMSSTRLPGKVLMDICGKPMIQHVMERCLYAAESIGDRVVLCAPANDGSAPLLRLAEERNWMYYAPKGTRPEDVGGRFCQAVEFFSGDPIIRITGDCPLIDPALIDWALSHYDGIFTATTPTRRTGFPDGQDIEIFPARFLDYIRGEEHVTTQLHDRGCRYLQASFFGMTWPEGKWSVDTQEDLDRVRAYMQTRS